MRPIAKYWQGLALIAMAVQSICKVAQCDNGPRTRDTLKDSVGDMMKHMEEFNITVQDINNDRRVELWIDVEGLQEYHADFNELRKRVEYFLTHEGASIDELREFIREHNPELRTFAMLLHRHAGGDHL